MKILYEFKNKLFMIYSAVFLLLALGMLGVFYVCTSSMIQKSSDALLAQTSEKILYKLDTIFESMNKTTLQVVANRTVQEVLLESSEDHTDKNYFDYYNKSEITNILNSINTPLLTNARISIFDQYKNYISTGYLSAANSDAFINNFSKYDNLTLLDESASQVMIYPPHEDNWVTKNPTVVFSFVRKIPYIDSINEFLGYIEIMQPYSLIEEAVSAATDTSITVVIIDEDDHIIYPYHSLSREQEAYYIQIKNEKSDRAVRSWDTQNELIYLQESSGSNWTVMLTQSENDYLAALRLFRKLLLFYSIIFYGFTTFILFTVTKRVTEPITQLRKQVEALNDSNLSLKWDDIHHNSEIIMLTQAFNHTIAQLKASMEQTLIANRNQVQAHILAMQSQMNPHFMFNTLMAISGIAEETDNIRIIQICDKLASMLRYISSFKAATVPLKDEIDYTVNYLELMKVRYEDFLTYELSAEEYVYEIPVVKLILQPLVENCFSHGFRNIVPPYYVRIDIIEKDGSLFISVTDNGSGVTAGEIDNFRKKVAQYKEKDNASDYINSSEIGGLGLINIYLRLQLKYGRDIDMTITNNEEAGCTVRIRLPLKSDRKLGEL